LLKQIAVRLREVVFATDTLARLGGDEFAVLLSSLTDENDIYPMLQKIQRVFATPFVLNKMSLDVQSSIGVALAPEHGRDVESLLQRADIAMYVAKEDRQYFHIYDANLDKHNSKRLSMLAQLRQAIANGDMRLHYQPKIESSTGLTKLRILGSTTIAQSASQIKESGGLNSCSRLTDRLDFKFSA